MLKQLLVAILFLLPLLVVAQKPDEELAAQFLANKEYEKAADQYEKLLNKNTRSVYYYDNLLKCYIALNNLDDASKLVKKQNKRFENNYYYDVDFGYVLKLKGEHDKANQHFKSIINNVFPVEPKVLELASAFNKRGYKEQAIASYLHGRKVLKRDLLFCIELAGLYVDLNQTGNAIDEYLNALVFDDTQTENVQGYLQNYLNEPAEYEILKQALIKKSRAYSDKEVFTEMLVWYYVQQVDFANALTHTKIIDKRNKEQGRRILDLGFLAVANKKYDDGILIFNYIVSLGSNNPFYAYAKNSIVEARSKKLLEGTYTKADLEALNTQYKYLIAEFGISTYMAQTLKDLANLQAYYLNQYDSAIENYERIINMPRLDPRVVANSKLDLADLYVYKNEIWEAMLLYGQVDNDYKEEPLGQEAKFRNARLSYFIGEFDWARAQLDVLKTATTQLIANNAIELSLIIQDNTVDSNDEPLRLFANADMHYFQNNFTAALKLLDSLSIVYPKHSLSDDIAFKRGEIYEKQKDYEKAAYYYQLVFTEFGSDILADNALYNLAKLNQYKLNNKANALKYYEKFIETFGGSFFLTDVRRQFRALRGDNIN